MRNPLLMVLSCLLTSANPKDELEDNQIQFYKDSINELQEIVRAQDTKIGHLLIVYLLPINQLEFTNKVLFTDVAKSTFCENIILILLIFSWIISVIALLVGIWPKWTKKNIDLTSDKICIVENLKKDRDTIHAICEKKIFCIRTSLIASFFWTVLFALKVILKI
ncbi:hypothetical protein [Neisseria sp. DTU_2021_1001991_1_SI_NGA_ILE_055]|uniref:hypothetical protein n=1 Tax=Neisseria sp. DTU_2021_1001991_1_SI_NGA_ILE_055 TaxID=3077590 RepID=UPI0028E2CEEA|nr:hypothetical protein [Neisseria sp. DTU_2021_1001991_1_SI_NGA_ILE_055]WNS83778.1 hypothetical protein RRV97_01205 [Neisseria sp. DTU_2021_1001991_1_SI_NGA_ILE_055]